MARSLIITALLSLGFSAQAQIIKVETCESDSSKMIYEVDLAKNAMSYLNGEGEITTEVAQRPITQVSEKDLHYLESEGVITQNKVSSGLKIMLQNPDSTDL